MQGSLCLQNGLLYVGRYAKTASVSVFDLDGRLRIEGFPFRDPRLGRSEIGGLAVDLDRHIWVADPPARRIRRFSVFGREIGGLGHDPDAGLSEGAPVPDRAGDVGQPVDVAHGVDRSEEEYLAVASGGRRRHAVQLFSLSGRALGSLRLDGDPRCMFQRVRRVAICGSLLYVVESGKKRVLVYRDGEPHFEFQLRIRSGLLEPSALAPLDDGRMIVACSGALSSLWLCDASGHPELLLADGGKEEGSVFEPNDVAVEPGRLDADTRVFVIDRDGERVQVFTLEGRCYGAFVERTGT